MVVSICTGLDDEDHDEERSETEASVQQFLWQDQTEDTQHRDTEEPGDQNQNPGYRGSVNVVLKV